MVRPTQMGGVGVSPRGGGQGAAATNGGLGGFPPPRDQYKHPYAVFL